MSTETKAALDAAIAAHFADEAQGAMMTGYVLKIDGRTVHNIETGESTTRWEIPDDQAVVTTMGLALAIYLDTQDWYRSLAHELDDD